MSKRDAQRFLVRLALMIGFVIYVMAHRAGDGDAAEAAVTAPETAATAVTVQVLPSGSSGMRFNPEAELDTSRVEDLRTIGQ